MANLPETEDFAESIYQIETSDRVLGGPGGIANKQAEQLGNRTAWLKAAISKIIAGTTAVGKATQLATARTFKFKGAVSGSGSFDGSADADINLALVDSGIAAGAYTKVVFNLKGLAVSGTNPKTLADFGIEDVFTKEQSRASFVHRLGDSAILLGWDGNDIYANVDSTSMGKLWHSGNFDPSAKANKSTTLGGYGIVLPTQAEAEAGADNTKPSTSLRVAQYVTKVLKGFQAALGFTPVQQGGGIGQTAADANRVIIGWSPEGRLKVTVDSSDLGPVAFTSNLQALVDQIVAKPPADLNTLQKLAFAVGNNANYAQDLNVTLRSKADSSTTLAGYGITLPTQQEAEAGADNSKPSTSLRVAQYVTKVLKGFQASLGFVPVQQGGGIGQTGTAENKLFLGFGTNSRLKATVDNTDLGNIVFDTTTAQEASPGVIKLATIQAVQLGAETLTAVTPKNLRMGFFISLSANGYIVFPTWLGSLMIQWGRYSLAAPTGAQTAVTYPIPFGTVLHAWSGVDGGATDQIGTSGITTTGMTVSKGSADTSPRSGSWLAIGGAF